MFFDIYFNTFTFSFKTNQRNRALSHSLIESAEKSVWERILNFINLSHSRSFSSNFRCWRKLQTILDLLMQKSSFIQKKIRVCFVYILLRALQKRFRSKKNIPLDQKSRTIRNWGFKSRELTVWYFEPKWDNLVLFFSRLWSLQLHNQNSL